MIKIFSIIIRFFSFFYSYKIHRKFLSARNLIYSLWIRNFVGSVGKNTKFGYQCIITGGGEKNIYFGDNTIIQSHSIIACWSRYNEQIFSPSITIGDNCDIGEYNHITACNRITIGNGLLTGRFVIITDNGHGEFDKDSAIIPPAKRKLISKGDVVIGNNVWLGDKVSILAGVHIGDNVIVAANAVVTKNIPSNCIAAGVPAKIIKTLGDI